MKERSEIKRALFLDRDGVINVDGEYLFKKEDFTFVDHIFDLCRFFIEKDFIIIVITNQSGIGMGLYTEKDFHDLTEWMVHSFASMNIPIAGVYYCPHHPDKGIGAYRTACRCRKPAPGMILDARRDHAIDVSRSILIGDKESDIEAGKNAGVGYTVLIESRYTGGAGSSAANLVAVDLGQALDLLKRKYP